MTQQDLRDVLSGATRFSVGTVMLTGRRLVRGNHPRVVTEVNPAALEAGWDPEWLVMDMPHDPAHVYRIRLGGVAERPLRRDA